MKKLLLLSCCFIATLSFSNSKQYYGKGYTIVQQAVKYDDLDVSVYKRITSNYVKDGLQKILKGTGWKLAGSNSADPEIKRLYRQPYPNHKRKIGPMPLDEALVWIAGPAWSLVVDPVNKLISFDLSTQYKCFPSTQKVCRP